MRLLNVAEKPSVASAIASILGEGRARKVSDTHSRHATRGRAESEREETAARSSSGRRARSPSSALCRRCFCVAAPARQRDGGSRYNPVFEFSYSVPGLGDCAMSVTSVAGHLLETEFEACYAKGWSSCDPKDLFFKAKVIKQIPSVRGRAHDSSHANATGEARKSVSEPPLTVARSRLLVCLLVAC